MEKELNLIDIADNLLILNKATIETLLRLDNCSNCIALYIFYYRTAKWQKTNKIKATDAYVCKSLGWGTSKLTTYKKILKDNGLIELIQNRKNGKIDSWYIQINYIVSSKKTSGLEFKINNLPVTDLPVAENTSSCSQETNALKEYIKCLKKEIEMLKKNNPSYNPPGEDKTENYFNDFWKEYPKRQNKKKTYEWFLKHKLTNEQFEMILNKLKTFKKSEQWKKNDGKFIPMPTTWLNGERWEDDISVEDIEMTDEEMNAEIERQLREEGFYDNR